MTKRGSRGTGLPTTKWVEQGESLIGQLGRGMGRERRADFRVATSASASISANLARQSSRLTRTMERQSLRQAAAVTRLSRRSKAVQRQVRAAQSSAAQYAGMGQVAQQQFGQARATAAAGRDVLAAQARQAAVGVGTAGIVARITGQGVAAADAAAQYALAQALQQRTIIDNQTLAQLSGDLYKTAMSYNMQWEMWKRQQEETEKKAKQEEKAAAKSIIAEAPIIGADAGDIIREAQQAEDFEGWDHFNITEAAQAWANENGRSPAETQLMIATLQRLKTAAINGSDVRVGPALQGAIDKLYGSLPGYERWGADAVAAVQAGGNAEWTSRFLAGAADDRAVLSPAQQETLRGLWSGGDTNLSNMELFAGTMDDLVANNQAAGIIGGNGYMTVAQFLASLGIGTASEAQGHYVGRTQTVRGAQVPAP